MSDLNLTPRRLELLAAIDRGEVTQFWHESETGEWRRGDIKHDTGDYLRRSKNVTKAVEELEAAGLGRPIPTSHR